MFLVVDLLYLDNDLLPSSEQIGGVSDVAMHSLSGGNQSNGTAQVNIHALRGQAANARRLPLAWPQVA